MRNDMKKKKWMYSLIPVVIVAFLFVGGEVVMHLWNWLAPALFGLRLITFWQALGLLALCRILFGGWGSGKGGARKSSWKKDAGWKEMTPEEREAFRHQMRNRCGGFGADRGAETEPA
jgi:hypothetical protein